MTRPRQASLVASLSLVLSATTADAQGK